MNNTLSSPNTTLAQYQSSDVRRRSNEMKTIGDLINNSKYTLNLHTLIDAIYAIFIDCAPVTRMKGVSDFFERYENDSSKLLQLRIGSGDFSDIKVIGKGANGKVKLVRYNEDSKVYAMKMLSKVEMVKRSEVAFFWEEREIMAHCNSDWIVRLHFAFQDERYLYMVMDYMAGGDFVNYMMNNDISVDDAKFFTAEIILAINDIHQMGYVHRDIKPENLLIDEKGHLKLADFGTCAKVDKESGLVKSSNAVGTPDYISPEVLRSQGGNEVYGRECDWWSVGVVLYEMLCGDTPFFDESLVRTYSNIMHHKTQLTFPEEAELSSETISVITGFLSEKEVRLGRNGIHEIQQHPFFADVHWQWNDIHNYNPPKIPELYCDEDTRNFCDVELSSDQNNNEPSDDATFPPSRTFEAHHLPFIGFSYSKNFPNDLYSIKEQSTIQIKEEEFQNKIEKLSNELEESKRGMEELLGRIDKLNREKREYLEMKERLNDDCVEMNKQLSMKTIEMTNMKKRIDVEMSRQETLSSTIQRLEKDLKEEQKGKESLKKTIKDGNDRYNQIEQELLLRGQQLNEKDGLCRTLEHDLIQLKHLREKDEMEKKEIGNQINELNEKCLKTTTAISQLEMEKRNLLDKNDDVSKEIINLKLNLENMEKNLQNEKKRISEMNEEKRKLLENINSLERENATISHDHRLVSVELNAEKQLRVRAEQESKKKQLISTISIDAQSVQLIHLNEERKLSANQQLELGELPDNDDITSSIDIGTSDEETVEKCLQKRMRHLEEMVQETEEKRRKFETDLSKRDKENALLQVDKRQLTIKCERIEESHRNELDDLKRTIELNEKKFGELEKQLEGKKSQVDILQDVQQKLMEEMEMETRQTIRLDKENVNLQKRMDDFVEKLETEKKFCLLYRAQAKEARDDYVGLQSESTIQSKKVESYKRQTDLIKEEHQKDLRHLETVSDELKHLREQSKLIEEEKNELKLEIVELTANNTRQTNNKLKDIHELNEKLTNVESDRDNLKSELNHFQNSYDDIKKESLDQAVEMEKANRKTESYRKQVEEEKMKKDQAIKKLLDISKGQMGYRSDKKMDREYRKLQQHLQQEKEQRQQENNKYQNELQEANSLLSEQEKIITRMRMEIHSKEARIEELQATLQTSIVNDSISVNSGNADENDLNNLLKGWLKVPKQQNVRKHGWKKQYLLVSSERILLYDREPNGKDDEPVMTLEMTKIYCVRAATQVDLVRVEKDLIPKIFLIAYDSIAEEVKPNNTDNTSTLSSIDMKHLVEYKGHTFIQMSFRTPTTCESCHKPLWNLLNPPPAFACNNCHVKVHRYHYDSDENFLEPCKVNRNVQTAKQLYLLADSVNEQKRWINRLNSTVQPNLKLSRTIRSINSRNSLLGTNHSNRSSVKDMSKDKSSTLPNKQPQQQSQPQNKTGK
ncbi:hypothetical protein SNEBB_010796 [Seison nebaliae]|nr:hypothetical protein SNEBB_010796 [Seison nebaliae]